MMEISLIFLFCWTRSVPYHVVDLEGTAQIYRGFNIVLGRTYRRLGVAERREYFYSHILAISDKALSLRDSNMYLQVRTRLARVCSWWR